MQKQRLALLGLAFILTSTVGLYAVNTDKQEIITTNYSLNENYEAVKSNIVEEDYDILTQPEVIDETKEIESTSIPEPQKDERDVIVSAYTLSKSECGKNPWDRGYGITRGGEDLRGKDWQSARVIAVDPKVLPLGSIVELSFYNEKYQKYNGIYLNADTGNAIKGNKVDLFLSETDRKSAFEFGLTDCKMTVISYGNN
jgi:3D (Asp-Asp-Asp) domain-containing protein